MPKLLLIGDKDLCTLLQKVLPKEKFETECAHTTDEVYPLLRKNGFDLILYDFRVLDSDGLSILRQIRAVMPNTPVIMLSNNPDMKTFVDAIRAGAVDCIAEPLNSLNILGAVSQVLSKAENSFNASSENASFSLKESAHRAELAVVLRVLADVKHNRSKAARILNIDRKTLYNKLKMLNLLDGHEDTHGDEGQENRTDSLKDQE